MTGLSLAAAHTPGNTPPRPNQIRDLRGYCESSNARIRSHAACRIHGQDWGQISHAFKATYPDGEGENRPQEAFHLLFLQSNEAGDVVFVYEGKRVQCSGIGTAFG